MLKTDKSLGAAPSGLSRRTFLRGSGVLGLGMSLFPSWMPRLVFSPHGQPAERDTLVVIFQRGGMDGLNAVIPYGEGARYYDRRPSIAIPESSILDLDGFFGFHPALAPLKEVYDSDALTIVHATGSPDPSRSHFDAMEFMERGTPGDKLGSTGWINRHLQTAAWHNDSPFRAIGMGSLPPSSLRGPVNTLALQSILDFHLGGREDQLGDIRRTLSGLYTVNAPTDALTQSAANVFNVVDLLADLSPENYTPSNGAAYPDGDFGLALQQVAMLIKAEVGLEVACVDIGGWDTHENQDGPFTGLLDELGRGLAAFYADLADRMRGVSVVSMSEFGRRVQENASAGTDHGHGNFMMLMGGGARSQVYAQWPGLHAEALDDGDLAITTDYRDILSEILVKRIGNSAPVFPNYTPTLRDLLAAR